MREVSLCGIGTASTTVVVSACTGTQLLLKSANLKTALFLVRSYKWMETCTVINIELIDVKPSGCCLLTVTYQMLSVNCVHIVRTTTRI